MDKCIMCGSYAINHRLHGRDGSDSDLCDVCYWRKRADDATEIMLNTVQTIDEVTEQEKRKARYEAIGWTHAFCCSTLDHGRDPRQVDFAAMLKQAKRELEPNA